MPRIDRILNGHAEDVLLAAAQARSERMLAEEPPPASRALRWHYLDCILPASAVYLETIERTGDAARARELASAYLDLSSAWRPKLLRALRLLPARFTLFRLANRLMLRAAFPVEGWDMTWHSSRDEFGYDMRSCYYMDAFAALGVPELAEVSCTIDDLHYAQLPAEITWERSGTLARGDSCCDFRHRRVR